MLLSTKRYIESCNALLKEKLRFTLQMDTVNITRVDIILKMRKDSHLISLAMLSLSTVLPRINYLRVRTERMFNINCSVRTRGIYNLFPFFIQSYIHSHSVNHAPTFLF